MILETLAIKISFFFQCVQQIIFSVTQNEYSGIFNSYFWIKTSNKTYLKWIGCNLLRRQEFLKRNFDYIWSVSQLSKYRVNIYYSNKCANENKMREVSSGNQISSCSVDVLIVKNLTLRKFLVNFLYTKILKKP